MFSERHLKRPRHRGIDPDSFCVSLISRDSTHFEFGSELATRISLVWAVKCLSEKIEINYYALAQAGYQDIRYLSGVFLIYQVFGAETNTNTNTAKKYLRLRRAQIKYLIYQVVRGPTNTNT